MNISQKMERNPFSDEGIASYIQYKHYPFLIFGDLNILKNAVEAKVREINKGYLFGDRFILLGEDRGLGKTSSLYFLGDLVKDGEIEVLTFNSLVDGPDHFFSLTGKKLQEVITKPVYILVDFPDTLQVAQFKKFCIFIESLMRGEHQGNVNLIFAMNRSHFDKSFSHTELLGKFTTRRLERLSNEETYQLISSRLRIVDVQVEEIFEDGVTDVIFNYSKGIPRNIISACRLLIDSARNGIVNKEQAESILKEKFIEQVINDRVSDMTLRKDYNIIINILKNEFGGLANKQEEFIEKVNDLTILGRNTILSRIKDLIKFGIFTYNKGGRNRTHKIISLN